MSIFFCLIKLHEYLLTCQHISQMQCLSLAESLTVMQLDTATEETFISKPKGLTKYLHINQWLEWKCLRSFLWTLPTMDLCFSLSFSESTNNTLILWRGGGERLGSLAFSSFICDHLSKAIWLFAFLMPYTFLSNSEVKFLAWKDNTFSIIRLYYNILARYDVQGTSHSTDDPCQPQEGVVVHILLTL